MCLSVIGTPYPNEQWLQHLPTVTGLIGLGFVAWNGWLNTFSYLLVVLFLWLHILGARWIYSFVPYDDWFEAILSTGLNPYFEWERNHYDRAVHFCFGLLFLIPFREVLIRFGRISGPLVMAVAWSLIMTVSAVYEIVEWQLAVWMSPEYAESYNGQQGDVWDAQQDMALAAAGALLAIVLFYLLHFLQSFRLKSSPSDSASQ